MRSGSRPRAVDLVAEDRPEELRVRGRRRRKVEEDLPAVVPVGRRLERALAADPLERDEELRALGEGEERLAALELAAARAARERLHADHVSRRQIEDRLEHGRNVAPRDDVLQELAAPDLLAHGLPRDLVPRLLDAAVDQPLDAVLGVLHDARRPDEGAEARRDVGPLGEVPADQLVELRRLLPERRRTVHRRAPFGADEEDDLVRADVGKAEGPLRHDAVGLERLEPPDEIEEQVVVGLPAPDLLDVALRARAEDEDRDGAPLLEPVLEVVDEDRHRGQPGLAVVETGALLEPLAAERDKLALLARGRLRRHSPARCPVRIAPKTLRLPTERAGRGRPGGGRSRRRCRGPR